MTTLVQEFPDPVDLRAAVEELQYLPGWRFELVDEDRGQGCKGLTFNIYPNNPDSYHPERHVATRFLYPVPAAAFNRESWEEWIWERIEETEKHERSEWFRFEEPAPIEPDDVCGTCGHKAKHHDGRISSCKQCLVGGCRFVQQRTVERRPYKPAHADGWNPGVVRTVVSETVTNTPNAGRLVEIPCKCGHLHRSRMGEHFRIAYAYKCDECDCVIEVTA